MANHLKGGDGSDKIGTGEKSAGRLEHVTPERNATGAQVDEALSTNADRFTSMTEMKALSEPIIPDEGRAAPKFDSFGLDMGDGTVLTAKGIQEKQDGNFVYERPSKQALEPMPSPLPALDETPYDSQVTLNVQITNVPEVPDPVNVDDLGQHAVTVIEAGAQAVRPIENWLATPNAVNDALASIAPALETAANYYANTPTDHVARDVQSVLGSVGEAIEDTLSHPMTPEERAKMAGTILPMFFFEGNPKEPINPKTVEQMGLEGMSEVELKTLGIESRPIRMQLERDEFSIQAKIPGDDKAWFRAELPEPGGVDVTALDKGALPDGMGGKFFAQVLKEHGAMPTKRLVLKNVINPETRAAYTQGVAAADTLLGRCAANALRELGITPKSFRFEVVRGKLNLVIEMR